MADRKSELIREEDLAWAEFCDLLSKVPTDRLEVPGITEEWSAKDLLGHLAAWWAEAGQELQRTHHGTYRQERVDIDEVNRRFYEANKDLDLHTIRAELAASRNKALEELWKLPELTPAAEEWFFESGEQHYRDHIPDLRRFVESQA